MYLKEEGNTIFLIPFTNAAFSDSALATFNKPEDIATVPSLKVSSLTGVGFEASW